MAGVQPRTNVTAINPLLKGRRYLYVVPLIIGTGQGKRPYYLQFDTGSSLTWTPCEPCGSCFNQYSQRFDPRHSPTYLPLPQNHHLCAVPFKPNGNNHCSFELSYGDGSHTKGILSQDTFTFQSDRRGHAEQYSGMVFGCAHSATIIHHSNDMDGIMGIGRLQGSLLMQLGHRQFSYCLGPPAATNSGYLHFGRSIHHTGAFKRTPILTVPHSGHYYLQLNGISINDRRLSLPPETFAHHGNHGGFFIDSGTSISYLIKPAYDEVWSMLVGHFQHLHQVNRRPLGDLCYETPGNYQNVLPHMTLHLEGADYLIENDKLFTIYHRMGFFCWEMGSSDKFTILGVQQQYNARFIYDIESSIMSFAFENCGP